MALATREQVETALRRSLDPSENVDGLLDTASDLVIGYLHPCPIPEPTPPAISRVVADMVVAVLTRPVGLVGEPTDMQAGPWRVGLQPGTNSPTPYLTAAMKARLAPYSCGNNGMVSVRLGSERR
ncbi:hypothetical protein [Tsukamurella tyrosinosolvens]|uniref:hypothetical protein n=1 Tax=Tsukamurella tyrosinosolvens TaxID=57704 RepID=UPI002DD437A9|nr:hypothetical protein [Tsukamurella tyrosinosolvens]MEC4616199.1 hypothetical protein [Tsukamurella tyrosinosolvens]